MEINWLTVAAQIVNFLVLVWLLQRFLYRPIVNTMDRREQRVADRLEEARKKSEQADKEAQDHRRERSELEQQRQRMLDEAKEEAEQLRKSLSKKIREDFDEKRKEWTRQLEREQEEFIAELRKGTGQQFLNVARRAFGDMANAELDKQIAEVFIGRLRALGKEEKRRLKDAVAGSNQNVLLRSAFDLPANLKRRLTKTVHTEIAEDADVSYEASRDLACGIELKAGSQLVTWSLDGYLDGIEEQLLERIRKPAQVREHRKAG